MQWRRFLSPRNYLDQLIQSYWSWTTPELVSPHQEVGIDSAVLSSLVVEWPAVYQWPPAVAWACHVMSGLQSCVKVTLSDIPQDCDTVILFCVRQGHQVFNVALDFADSPESIQESCVRRCLVYFKMQFLKGGYSTDKIVPGQYVPSGRRAIYRYLPRLRQIHDRLGKPRFDVYGRFGLPSAEEIRSEAVRILSRQRAFRYVGGGTLVPLSRSLREAASAAICIDLPGAGPFCFRLIDYLAIGACVVAYPHRATLDPPLEDRRHLVYCRPDFADLLDLCSYYLHHPDERTDIARAARAYYDQHLHKNRLAAYYLAMIVQRMTKQGTLRLPVDGVC